MVRAAEIENSGSTWDAYSHPWVISFPLPGYLLEGSIAREYKYLRCTTLWGPPTPLQVALSPEAPSSWPWKDPRQRRALPSFPPSGTKLIFSLSLDPSPEIWAHISHCPPSISMWASNRPLKIHVSKPTLLSSETAPLPLFPAQISPSHSSHSPTENQGVSPLFLASAHTHVQTLSKSKTLKT